MDTKVLRTFSQVLDASGELISTVESPPGGFQFSKSFQYVARLGDTKNASVYMARSADGEFAIKVRPMQDVVATILCLMRRSSIRLQPAQAYIGVFPVLASCDWAGSSCLVVFWHLPHSPQSHSTASYHLHAFATLLVLAPAAPAVRFTSQLIRGD